MKHVQISSIEKAIEKVDNLNDEGLEKLAETYALSQQVLLGYIMQATVEYQNPKLEGLLIYYFCIILEAFSQEKFSLKTIEETDINEFEEPFFDALGEYFEKENEEAIEEFCDQPHLTQLMAMEVSTPDVDGTTLDDETASQLFIVSTAMIGLLGRSIKA